MLSSDERFEITAIAHDSEPIEPIRTKNTFAAQCGVLVRDKIPISIHQWYKPAKDDPEVSYVNGKPLVKDERSLTMMMRRFHDWYMKT